MGRIWAGLLAAGGLDQQKVECIEYQPSGGGQTTNLRPSNTHTFESELPLRAGHRQGGHAPLVPLVESVAQHLQYSTVQYSTVQCNSAPRHSS